MNDSHPGARRLLGSGNGPHLETRHDEIASPLTGKPPQQVRLKKGGQGNKASFSIREPVLTSLGYSVPEGGVLDGHHPLPGWVMIDEMSPI
ncbi:hypothetical protein G6O67_007268 [Ophiocordyceps sinensis]|uniref:Uncharacterized protein n=1 Tax=Ophiocordyceps sinensis TaxID=72228 RepID=A0A8H4LTT7_9HYPO|nr:hypothetical protein G6O67_007268 [Ophiocordyceps sinensis]